MSKKTCNPNFKLIILSPCWWPASSWHEPIDVKLMFIMPVIPRENYLLRIVTLLRQPLYKPYLFGACLYAFAQWSKTLHENQYSYFVSWYPQYGHSQSEKKLGVRHKYHCSIKVHTQETQNQHQLKSPLSEPNLLSKFQKMKNFKNFRINPKIFFALQYIKN